MGQPMHSTTPVSGLGRACNAHNQVDGNPCRARLMVGTALGGWGSRRGFLAGSAEGVLWFWTARETAWPNPKAGNEGQGVERLDLENLVRGTDR